MPSIETNRGERPAAEMLVSAGLGLLMFTVEGVAAIGYDELQTIWHDLICPQTVTPENDDAPFRSQVTVLQGKPLEIS